MIIKNLSEREQPEFIPMLRLRVFAALIDWLIIGLLIIGLTLCLSKIKWLNSSEYSPGAMMSSINLFYAFLIWLALIPITEGLTGRSIGKRIMKMRVVRLDFSDISLSNSLLRHLFDIFEFAFLFGVIAVVTAKSNKYYRRIGDLFALTMVVKDE